MNFLQYRRFRSGTPIVKLSALFTSVLLLIIGCNNQPIYFANEVNIGPLYNADIPTYVNCLTDIIEVDRFDSYKIYDIQNSLRSGGDWLERGSIEKVIEDDSDSSANFEIMFSVFSSVEDAESWYSNSCQIQQIYSTHVTAKGKKISQYCITYLEEMRAGPEAFNKPLGRYDSYIVIQKGNLVINITERTNSVERDMLNDEILQLREALIN